MIRNHFETNPAVPGTPISPSPASTKAPMVSGMVRPIPAICSIRVIPVENTMQPMARNRVPLMMAWLNRWLIPPVSPVWLTSAMPSMM